MMLRGNLKQVHIEKNPACLRALESAAGERDPAALALALIKKKKKEILPIVTE